MPDLGPPITHLGLARADDQPIARIASDETGREIYRSPLGQGMSLIVEARPGPLLSRVGMNAYQPFGLPDLQIILSRPLGDGSTSVCDNRLPDVGGVPATTPLLFSGSPGVSAAINDLGCRVDNGAGQPLGRASQHACTRADGTTTGFAFVSPESSIQYCLPIAGAWRFPAGDTIVAARVRDVDGRVGQVREMVIRVGSP
jgi:hypothetical protein